MLFTCACAQLTSSFAFDSTLARHLTTSRSCSLWRWDYARFICTAPPSYSSLPFPSPSSTYKRPTLVAPAVPDNTDRNTSHTVARHVTPKGRCTNT